MIRLILARHGNTFEAGQTPTQVGARTDLPLTAEGRQQAEQLAIYLQSRSLAPAAIYAGPLQRQIEAAQILHRAFACPIHLHEAALAEIDYGLWEGLSAEAIAARWPHEYRQWTESALWPQSLFGGALDHHLALIERWIAALRQAHSPNATLVAISSNGLMRLFHPEWKGIGTARQMETLKVKTGHFCELHLHPDSLSIHSWNVKPSTNHF